MILRPLELVHVLAGEMPVWLRLLDENGFLLAQIEPKAARVCKPFERQIYSFTAQGECAVTSVSCYLDKGDVWVQLTNAVLANGPRRLKEGDRLNVSYAIELDSTATALLQALTLATLPESENERFKEHEQEEEKAPDGPKRVLDL